MDDISGSIPGGSIRGTIPLSVVLSWPTPNYVDPIRRPWMAALAIPLAVASTLMVSIRLWSRFTRQAGKLGIDDMFIVASWMFAAVLSAAAVVSAEKYGGDRHVWDVPFEQHVPSAMYGWIGEVAYLVSTCFCKIGILLFYRRMVTGTLSKGLLYASWVGIAFNTVYGIVFIVMLCTNCMPLDAYWKSYDLNYNGPYKCKRPGESVTVSGALSAASDFYAVILPYFAVRDLQIPKRQKYGLYAVFGFGLVVVGCGVARTIYIDRLANKSYDTTWVAFEVFAASLLETQFSIIGACLPNLRKVFGTYFGESLSKVYSNLRFGTSKDSKNFSNRRTPAAKEKKILSSVEDIELAAGSVQITSGSVAPGSLRSPTDHEYFERAYVKRFTNATVSDDDLLSRGESNSMRRLPVFPHTVF